VPHGQALGVTLQMPLDDRHNYPEDYLLARMAVMLGGRLAEEIVFRAPTSGAENDLMQVTRLARQMVARWGMSAKVGQLAYSVAQEHPFLGRDMMAERDFSEKTAALIDDAQGAEGRFQRLGEPHPYLGRRAAHRPHRHPGRRRVPRS